MIPSPAGALLNGVATGALGAVAASLRHRWGALSTLGTHYGQQRRQMSAGAPDEVNSFVREVKTGIVLCRLPAASLHTGIIISSSNTAEHLTVHLTVQCPASTLVLRTAKFKHPHQV